MILSGSLGDHGIAILSEREGLELETEVRSDSAALNTLVDAMLEASRAIRCMRDPTRGGLASTLNEIAGQSRVGIEIDERAIRVNDAVRGACELLGFDPLYVANEGKLAAIVAPRRPRPWSPPCAAIRWAATPPSSDRSPPRIRAW